MERLTGQTLGQYQLRSLLGMGGMGAVYEGYQPSLRRPVAVKVLFSTPNQQLGNYEERFVQEARTAAALEHPHIVPVYDYGIEREISYVVMRLLKGGTLAERLENGGSSAAYLALDQAIQTTVSLASALLYAHQQGVIHRDIKAKNVMFDEHGTVMLVDFGLAKLVGNTSSLTLTGKFAGTPEYMAPEQWRGDSTTPAIDQYALAILVHEMLTGHRVFEGDSHYEMMHKHTQEAPSLRDWWRDDLPEAIIPVLSRALRKDPKTRYPNVRMFAKALNEAAKHNAESGLPQAIATPSPVTDDRHRTIILMEEAGETHSRARRPGWKAMIAVALMAVIIAAFVWLPGLPGGVFAINDTPSPTAERNEIAPGPITEIPAGIELTDDPTATTTPSPPPAASPTLTATTAPSPTQTMTVTAPPTSTDAPTNTATRAATPGPLVIAQIACDQMDVNDDGIVNIYDLRILAAVIGSKRGDDLYQMEYDYNNNAVVDQYDLQFIASQYDRRCR